MYKYIIYNIQMQTLNTILFSTVRYSNPNLWPMTRRCSTIKPNFTIVNKSRNSWKVILVYSRLENSVTVTIWKKRINRIAIVFHSPDNSFTPLLSTAPDEDFLKIKTNYQFIRDWLWSLNQIVEIPWKLLPNIRIKIQEAPQKFKWIPPKKRANSIRSFNTLNYVRILYILP